MKDSDGFARSGQGTLSDSRGEICASSSDDPQTSKITSALDHALAFAQRGFRIFPIYNIGKDGHCSCQQDCSSPGKHPRFAGWKRDATTHEKTIRNWARKHPQTNFAAVAGPGHVVLDLDQREAHNGFDTFAKLQGEHAPVGPTLTVKTPSGLHLYFKTKAPIGNGAGKIGEGIDHRGIGGYVLLPGSNHHSGAHYQLLKESPCADLPPWIETLILETPSRDDKPSVSFKPLTSEDQSKRQRAYLHAALEGEAQKVMAARQGHRNNTLNTSAIKLYSLSLASDLLTSEEIRERLTDAALTCGLKNRAIQATLKSAKRGARARALPDFAPLPPLPPQNLRPSKTEVPKRALVIKEKTLAKEAVSDEQQLAKKVEGKLKASPGRPSTFAYSVKTNDDGQKIIILEYVDDVHCAEAISRELLFHEGALRYWRGEFYKFRAALGFHMISVDAVKVMVREALCRLRTVDKSGNLRPIKISSNTINNVTNVIKTLRRVYVPESYQVARWQGGRWQEAAQSFSAQNGVLDLQSQSFEAHHPDLFCPRVSDFAYDPSAKTPVMWLQFLEQIFTPEQGTVDPLDVQAKIEALQRYLGLSLCPAALNIQKGVWLTGPTRSGKGTIIDIATSLVGQQSTSALEISQIGERFGLSNVPESSLLTLPEQRTDRHTSQSKTIRLFLQLLARDAVRIEKKGKNAFTIKPTVTLIAASNDVPQWEDISGAMHTRFIYLHTPNSFLGREDPKLADQLKAEGSAILTWALLGLQKILKDGLSEPKSSLAVKGQECSAGLPAYITQELVFDPLSEARQNELYQRYKDWCENTGEPRLSVKHLLSRLKMAAAAAGHQLELEYRTLSGRLVPYFKGVSLASPFGAG